MAFQVFKSKGVAFEVFKFSGVAFRVFADKIKIKINVGSSKGVGHMTTYLVPIRISHRREGCSSYSKSESLIVLYTLLNIIRFIYLAILFYLSI